jgi:hypothetical protein
LVLVLLVAHGLFAFGRTGLFFYIGQDYRAFRALAEVVSEEGFLAAYDLERLAPIQKELLEGYAPSELADAPVIPVPYLPAFLVPFLGLLALPPLPAWWAVLALNVLGLGVYLLRLRSVLGPGGGLYWLPLLALPAYLTVLFGQVNLLLLIGFGEFLLALRRGRYLRAGLWLSLLLIKPQSLLLVVPGMVISGRSRVLLGFAAAGAGIGALSFALAGTEGARGLARLLLLYPGDLPTTFPESMMTWRAVLAPVVGSMPAPFPTVLAIGASIATAVPGAWIWRLGRDRQDALAWAGLGSYAATCAVAWHAHVHMALPMVVPLLWLAVGTAKARWPLVAWILLPSGVFCVLAIWVGLWEGHVAAGWTMFGLNLLLLGWSVKRLCRPSAQGAQRARSPD